MTMDKINPYTLNFIMSPLIALLIIVVGFFGKSLLGEIKEDIKDNSLAIIRLNDKIDTILLSEKESYNIDIEGLEILRAKNDRASSF